MRPIGITIRYPRLRLVGLNTVTSPPHRGGVGSHQRKPDRSGSSPNAPRSSHGPVIAATDYVRAVPESIRRLHTGCAALRHPGNGRLRPQRYVCCATQIFRSGCGQHRAGGAESNPVDVLIAASLRTPTCKSPPARILESHQVGNVLPITSRASYCTPVWSLPTGNRNASDDECKRRSMVRAWSLAE